MRSVVVFLLAATHADAQVVPPAAEPIHASPHALGFYGGTLLLNDFHVDGERGALVGGMFEARLYRNRVGVGHAALLFRG
ncbi:MAG: hypothetical protein ACI9KE_000851 [Polyangiales bacterium]|jgi:hypothetical protein